jgi:hydrogenase maturation protein HypF
VHSELDGRCRLVAVKARTRLTVKISGTVQGVGFRPFVFGLAQSLDLAGSVANTGAHVLCIVEGSPAACDEFVQRVQTDAPELAELHAVTITASTPVGDTAFMIANSSPIGHERSSAIPPDIATCASCRAEAADETNRRYEYPFICCTECGPRYTVVQDLPYDRGKTSLADFPLCDLCQAEYEDPSDRRFHAQATSCADCGPQLTGATIAKGIEALLSGATVAVKGLGGYQLLCRADRNDSVQQLRNQKHRESKPFALLVGSLTLAERLVELDDVSREALESPAAPIVLARARSTVEVATAVAPGTRLLGVMLPASHLHAMLATGVGVPLVCTSGNRSNEPIVIDDEVAAIKFGNVADLVISHNRRIERRADDSVGIVMDSDFQVLRRARGYAPRPITLASLGPTVLGVGAELKSATCLAVTDRASLSVHLGDLESPQTLRAFEETIADQIAFAEADVALIVHDLHPEYLSTKFAKGQDIAPTLAVQHHHAHLVSCLVENVHSGSAIGVVFDGFGWGEDGTAWGGEFLVGDAAGYERAAFLDPVPLPGGVKAIREPWRMTVAHCIAAFGEVPSFVRSILDEERLDAVAVLCAEPATLRTASVGRLFDAVAGLCGLAKEVTYEGEAAIALEGLASLQGSAAGGDRTEDGYVWSGTDASAVVRTIVGDLEGGVDRSLVAYRFHRGLADFVVSTCLRLRDSTGLNSVALSGGVFQNRLLVELLVPTLDENGFHVMRHRQVPPNDGGISLGQVAIGRAHLASGNDTATSSA